MKIPNYEERKASEELLYSWEWNIDGIRWRKDRFVLIETPMYNIWNLRAKRWTNAYYNEKQQNPDEPLLLSKEEAQRWLYKLQLGPLGFEFEIRPIISGEILLDQKCSKCQKPCPHQPPNQEDNTYICSFCLTIKSLEE